MATIKSYTDLEQSKILAEILPLESADIYYKYVLPKSDRIIHIPEIGNPIDSLEWYNAGYTFRGKKEPITLSEYCMPCWSLTSLLDVLNKCAYFINEAGIAELSSIKATKWCISILNCGKIEDCYADNSIDACYEMVLKLHELKML